MPKAVRAALWIFVAVAIAWISAEAAERAPAIAANGLLHPFRRPVRVPLPHNCKAEDFSGAGVVLKGWRCSPREPSRGTVIFLHGVADNRGSGSNIIGRYTRKGFNVIAYDSRAHGESGGAVCTYGYFEKDDLRTVIKTVEDGPIILIGTSLGAAVALQAAALDSRITGVIGAEIFSDLRSVAMERAPLLLPDSMIARAFRLAERSGRFEIDGVSPVSAAKTIRIPVLLFHGTEDRDTPAAHSQRVMAALAGPKRLILVDGAAHNQSLTQESAWREIDRWIEEVVPNLPTIVQSSNLPMP